MNEYDIQDILRELAVSTDNGRLVAANLLRSLGYQEPHIRYLSGPIVTQARTAQVAPWLAKTIIQDRLSMIFYEASARTVGFYATPVEVLTYISEDTQWSRLYTYLTEQMRLRYDNDLSCWELAHPKVTNLSGFDLSGPEGKEYLNLAGLVRYLVLAGAPYIAPASFVGSYKYPTTLQHYQNGFESLFRQN